jgi:ribosomal protein S18 acetylase RimI-like enzyme
VSAVTIRPATAADDAALRALNVATWSPDVGPGPRPAPGAPFFDERSRPDDVLVAVDGAALAGYVRLGRPTDLASNDHVVAIDGLAVDPAHRRRGVARRLLDAAIEAARARGARRLTLRVLGPNATARALYEAAGFTVEGVLRDEFRLAGRYVDDVLMALDLTLAAPVRDE